MASSNNVGIATLTAEASQAVTSAAPWDNGKMKKVWL